MIELKSKAIEIKPIFEPEELNLHSLVPPVEEKEVIESNKEDLEALEQIEDLEILKDKSDDLE